MKNALDEPLPRARTPIRQRKDLPSNAPNQTPFGASFRTRLKEFKKSSIPISRGAHKTILLHIRAPDKTLKIKKLAVNDKIFKQVSFGGRVVKFVR